MISLGINQLFSGFSAITIEPETAESQSKAHRT